MFSQRHAEEQTRNNTELARINRLRAEKEARERARKEAEKRGEQHFIHFVLLSVQLLPCIFRHAVPKLSTTKTLPRGVV